MIGPKEKKERALGEHLHLKGYRCASPKCALLRKPYRPGMHGKSRTRALSDFGRQIREKQKFKLSYGIDERNLRNVFERARRAKGSTATRLIELLERRLDNVVYQLRFAPSRSAARQIVTHGHITVNGTRVRSPGFTVSPGDVVAVRPASLPKAAFKSLSASLEKYEAPAWLHLDAGKLEGKVLAASVDAGSPFEVNLLVESFSK